MAVALSSSSSSSSVTMDGYTYDVFLSFRGLDTRHGFTGNLWKALDDRGIRTFFDKEDIQKGEEITPTLLEAIKQSRTAIVVLSRDYVSSAFCLRELSHILDCIQGRGRFIWPVFYEVNPSDVRWLEGTFKKAMGKHEARHTPDELKKWNDAMHKLANLSGTPFKAGGGYDYEFIEKIVEEVSRRIKPFTLHVDKTFGLELQKQRVKSLLNLEANDEVHMVGIHGIGGIGKTTLALEVYNLIAHQFGGSCFLAKVRENSQILHRLQKILLSDTVGENKIEIANVNEGIHKLQQRLRQKKVLLILDDVDELEQLEAMGRPEWFGPGSRIIITTRDTGLLESHGVKIKHEVTGMNKEDALELLRWKAFKTDDVSSSYADVLNRAITYAFGLPLALEVIGSNLFKRGIEKWKYTLDQYERIPHKKIQTVLEVSFNALDRDIQSVFLDIACFFNGYKLKNVEKILHAHHGNRAKGHIRVLVEKSLIKISDAGDVTLHDLIEDMGKEIVQRPSPEDPGKRSRLWNPKDIVKILEEKMGTSEIEAIYLDSPIEVNWDGKAFKKTKKLRTLIIEGRCCFSTSPKYLPNSLRILIWKECSSSFPCDFYPKELAICKLAENELESIRGDLFKKKFENMLVLNLDDSRFLTQIPDVSGLRNLEEFSFQDCQELITIDDSVGQLDKLKILNASGCMKLRSFPTLKLVSLEELDISFCDNLENFPPVVDGLLCKLKILCANYCSQLKSFPSLKLDSLEALYLSNCDSLESFPPVVGGLLNKLEILHAKHCRKLKSFPSLKFASLRELDLSCCGSLESFLPVQDGLLDKLEILRVEHCGKLKSFPSLKLASLQELDLSHCGSLKSFPPVQDGLLDKLEILRAKHCGKLKIFPPLKLASLKKLDLSHCDSLESFSPVVDSVDGCSGLGSVPLLNQLDLSYCYNLKRFPEILGEMENITKLELEKTPIKELPFSFQNFTRLRRLYLSCCGIIRLPSSIVMMSELVELTIVGGGWLFPKQDEGEEKVSPMQSSQVEFLHLWNCNLSDESLAIGLKWFANVKELDLSGSKFTTLPECIEKCQFLGRLILKDCEELQEIKGIPPSLKILSVLNCKHLTLSCKKKLLNQKLHEAGNTWFVLPGADIPEWFEHQCMEGKSFSFWFRNICPVITLCVVSDPLTWDRSESPYEGVITTLGTSTDGSEMDYSERYLKDQKTYHLHIFNMQPADFLHLEKENMWSHATVYLGLTFQKIGIHVLNKRGNVEDIRFTDPENDVL